MDNPFDQFINPASNPLDTALLNENITGLKADFIRSIYQQESGKGKNTKTSNAGAVGGMQIIPSTFKSVAEEGWDINDPVQNAQAGARYASQMWEKAGGDPKLAAAGYYGGPGGLEKARQGRAVFDPRNPEAPSTLQYGEQVASRMASTKKAPGQLDNPFQQFKGEEQNNPFQQFIEDDNKKQQARPREDNPLTSTIREGAKGLLGNIIAGTDFLASTPGALLQPMAAAVGRGVAEIGETSQHGLGSISAETEQEKIAKFGHQFGQEWAQKTTEFFETPVHKLLQVAGIDMDTSESGVNQALNKVTSLVNKGADHLYELADGKITREDAQDLVNSAALLVAPSAIRGTAKALVRAGEGTGLLSRGSAGEATIREADSPAQKLPQDTPESLAKKHIEETTGVNRSKQNTKDYRQTREAEVRAAFSDDAEWGRYTAQYAKAESTAPEVENQIQADKLEQTRQIEQIRNPESVKPPEPVIFNDIKPILDKPVPSRTPEEIDTLRTFNKQGGKVDPEMLAKMAAMGIGITAGINLDPDNKFEGALLGVFGGYAAAKGLIKAPEIGQALKNLYTGRNKPDTQIRITDPMTEHQTAILKGTRMIWQHQDQLKQLAPDEQSRTKITRWQDGDKTIPLTDKEYQAAKLSRSFYDSIGQAGLQSGALTNLIDDYVSRQWDLEGVNKKVWDKLTSGMSVSNKHNLRRKISTLEEGKKLGLKPVTEDIAVLSGLYGSSMIRTMANIKFIDTVKGMKDPQTGIPLITSGEGAPKNYVPIDRPNTYVHPDIKPSMDFLFSKRDPTSLLSAMRNTIGIAKRMEVMNPVFHIKSLMDVSIGAGQNPFKVFSLAMGKHDVFRQMREGGAGDYIDKAHEGGVIFTLEGHELADKDVDNNYYQSMGKIQNLLDDMLPGGGKLAEAFIRTNHFSDKILWERIHAGFKVTTFADAYNELKKNNEEAHASDPRVPLKSEKELTGIAGRYTNTLYGGMNWMRSAEEVHNRFLRNLALKAYAPAGRQVLQDLFFAPDWKISTTQAFVDAFGKGTGFKGLLKPQELADLHRRFMIRNALYYTTVGNALNYALSGHPIWDNKDKTQLELSDGRTMQFSKHMMDPIHLIQKPGQEILSALGVGPSEALEQLMGKQYLSTKGAPNMDTSLAGRLRHAAKKLVPIGGQGRDVESDLAGNLGFSVAGRTPEMIREDRQAARELDKKKREESGQTRKHKRSPHSKERES